MFRKIITVSAFAAGFASLGAQASELTMERAPVTARAAQGLMLAQQGDVEIYIDEYGRRVIVDAYTGQVIAVQPRVVERRELRRQHQRQDRYYLDDPADMERLRQDRMRELGRVPGPPPIEEYEDFSRGVFPEPPLDASRRSFPEEADVYPLDPYEPEVVTREPIERSPLGDYSIVNPEISEQPSIIEEPAQPSMTFTAREEVAALQILLDRAGASPGVIDGKFGSNVDKAILGYRAITGENLRSTDAEGIKAALQKTGGDPFTTYTITAADAAGPFVAAVPADYGEKAKLDRMSYTSVAEMLAERFHMDEAYLKTLNPEANFGRVGTIIQVANIGKPVTTKVARIVAEKTKKQVRAYDENDKLVAVYPATIGSSDTPSPTGTHAVSRVALDPQYTYNPKLNFKQGENDKVLTIPPGPNGPVGSVWIALDKPTYGIHGTPDPSKIGKTESHGCVRLTNWDAQELATLVSSGVQVEFGE